MNQNSGRTNISDILPQRCYGHFEKSPDGIIKIKRFLYFISSYAYNKKQKSQCANFFNPGISTLAIQKGYLPYFTWITKYLDTLQNSVGLVIFNVNWPLSSFTNS